MAMTIKRSAVLVAGMALGSMTFGCGGDDNKKSTTEYGMTRSGCQSDCLGNGWILTSTTEKFVVDFPDSSAGEQYVIMPYILGDLTTVSGASTEKFNIKVTSSTGSSALRSIISPDASTAITASLALAEHTTSWHEYDHAMRSLLNRFDASLGMNQMPGFWSATAQLDKIKTVMRDQVSLQGFITEKFPDAPSVTNSFKKMIDEYEPAKAALPMASLTNMTTAGECPTGKVVVPTPAMAYDAAETATILSSNNGDDFCLVYISNPVTEDDKEATKTSIKEILKRYKEVIYKDAFANKGAFIFKPVIVVADFSDSDVWPPAEKGMSNPTRGITGVLLPAQTKGENRPMLYMAADVSKIGGPTDKAQARKTWHGTLAHEMQHAIMNYYRNGATAETIALDEGIAHFMEDIFGYGGENFPSYVKAFISIFPEGISAFLDGTSSVTTNNALRGAAQTLLYYLSSQKGGVKFSDGRVSGGDGLQFIVDLVKNSTNNGPANLNARFASGEWVEVIGRYLGALILDNSKVSNVAALYTTQTPVQNVYDLTGAQNKVFGMRFNGFSSLTEPSYHGTDSVTSFELHHYQSKPVLYTVKDPAGKLTFELPDVIKNSAVSVVRIK